VSTAAEAKRLAGAQTEAAKDAVTSNIAAKLAVAKASALAKTAAALRAASSNSKAYLAAAAAAAAAQKAASVVVHAASQARAAEVAAAAKASAALQTAQVAFRLASASNLRVLSVRKQVRVAFSKAQRELQSASSALQIREAALKSALSKAVLLSKSMALAKQAADRARMLSKQTADRALALSASALNLGSAARKMTVEDARSLGASAKQSMKAASLLKKDVAAIAAVDAAAKTEQDINAKRINALTAGMRTADIASAAQQVVQSEASRVAKLSWQRAEASLAARAVSLKAKMLQSKAQIEKKEYHRLLNLLNRKYQAVKDARATAHVEVQRYQSALKRLRAARVVFEAATGRKLLPMAAESDKLQTMSMKIKDAFWSANSVLKMAHLTGVVDHTVDSAGSAGAHLGTATAETLRAKTLEHLLGVTEHASEIRKHTLQHLLGVSDRAKALEMGTLGEISKHTALKQKI
jgi:hypothetical protein